MIRFGKATGLSESVMAMWGVNVVVLKILITYFMPVTITTLRILSAGIVLVLTLFTMRKLRSPTKQEWVYIIFGSLFSVVLHQSVLSIGLNQTTASNSGLILGMAPLATTILSILFLGDRVTILQSIGVMLGLIGVSFIVLKGHKALGSVSMGDLLVFISMLFQALSFIVIKKGSQTMDPRLMTTYI
ncbi:DMT family transporter [Ammoniphilus sp. 3BR4]|uniref:DMT family transporter n=1 Tax=Ammoniphilus sp. 3BR4 TaxID=3158265 RepID=UPI00346727AD